MIHPLVRSDDSDKLLLFYSLCLGLKVSQGMKGQAAFADLSWHVQSFPQNPPFSSNCILFLWNLALLPCKSMEMTWEKDASPSCEAGL